MDTTGFRQSPNVEDRRGEDLQIQALMGMLFNAPDKLYYQNPAYQAPVSPLGQDLGVEDIGRLLLMDKPMAKMSI